MKSIPFAAVVMFAALLPAKEIVAIGAARKAVSPKAGTKKLTSAGGSTGKGKAVTDFRFHPEAREQSPLAKDAALLFTVTRANHSYSAGHAEKHGTTGDSKFTLISEVYAEFDDETGGDVVNTFRTWGLVRATIRPGDEAGRDVSIDATLLDPFVFSDTHPEAAFSFTEGLDTSFSLLRGTSFPEVFSDDPSRFGAIAGGTSLRFRQRVRPGVVSEPDSFWADDAPGSIDLWTIDIRSDEDYSITVDLSFGEPNAYFALDYFDYAGVAFDRNDPAHLFALRGLLASAFTRGTVPADLLNAFGVGFKTQAGVTEYTLGDSWTTIVAAWETPVPEPAPALLAGFALLVFGLARKRAR